MGIVVPPLAANVTVWVCISRVTARSTGFRMELCTPLLKRTIPRTPEGSTVVPVMFANPMTSATLSTNETGTEVSARTPIR